MSDASQPDHGAPKDGAASAGAPTARGTSLKRWLVLVGAGVVVVAIIAFVLCAGGPPPGPDPVIYQEGHNPFTETRGPACVGMPLGGGAVVYCVDASSAMAYTFDAIRSAVARSLATLAPGQSFGLVVWTEGKPTILSSAGSTPKRRAAAAELLDSVQPSGSTDALAGIRAALALGPETLCIVAAKGPDEGEVDALARQMRDADVVLRCLAIRDEAPALAALAEKTEGSYQRIDPDDLRLWLDESE